MSNSLYDALFAPLAGRSSPLLLLQNGTKITGQAFHIQIAQVANALRRLGVQPGERVAVQVAKSPEALASYAATTAVGAVFLPLNTAYTADELDYFIGNAKPAVFLCDPNRVAELAPVAMRHGAQL